MNQLNSYEHARILYRDWLQALRSLREAQTLYMERVTHYERERKSMLGLAPGEELPKAEKRMASFRADSDDQIKIARSRTTFYMEMVRTMGISFLVEMQYAEKFTDERPPNEGMQQL